ncbi:CRISPR-associated protein Cas5 [Runella zeae]|uniref:CRISPR-associated protein Cas5 n=1 Tax=Runella zeae TaxID=94255 RepID=UPI00068662F3|nr:CRISPR-associated protein Cas5 [Runella zeae]
MEILQLDVGGKLAHFRKYYANNTAMSFSIPPRTTMMGMLASILGRERDSYYEELASERIRISVRVMSPLKKTFHRLNFLSIKSKSDFDGSGGRIQTPFEIVSGYDISKDMVVYRLYVSCSEDGKGTFDELKEKVLQKQQHFALTLGTANFTASLLDVKLFVANEIQETEANGFVTIHSAVPSEAVERIDFDRSGVEDLLQMIEEELLPADFVRNYDRELRKMNRTLFSTSPTGMRLELNRSHYQLTNAEEVQNILFLE